jgi:hypothetical protein
MANAGFQTFDDELDAVPTPAAQPQQQARPAQTATAAAPAQHAAHAAHSAKATTAAAAVAEEDEAPAAKVADNENLDTDFDDKRVYDRPGQLNQCRPEKGKAARFSFIPKEWIAPQTAKSHFLETGTGKDAKKIRARCLTPMGADADPQYCCVSLDEDGEVSVVGLVVRYTNADPVTGKYEKDAQGNFPPIEFAIEFVRLSQFNMRQIKKLPDEDKTPFDIDLVMTHADRAFGYEFNRKSNVPRWTLDPAVAAAVKAAAQRFIKDGGKVLRAKLGQKLNEIEWKALLSGKKVGGESKIENVDEL